MPWLHSAEHLELVADGEGQKWEPAYSDAGPANMLHLTSPTPPGGDDHPPQRPALDRPARAAGPMIRIVILHPATASDAAKLERLAP